MPLLGCRTRSGAGKTGYRQTKNRHTSQRASLFLSQDLGRSHRYASVLMAENNTGGHLWGRLSQATQGESQHCPKVPWPRLETFIQKRNAGAGCICISGTPFCGLGLGSTSQREARSQLETPGFSPHQSPLPPPSSLRPYTHHFIPGPQ